MTRSVEIFPQKICRRAAPSVTIAVYDRSPIRRFVRIQGVVKLPEGICSLVYHFSPVVAEELQGMLFFSAKDRRFNIMVHHIRSHRGEKLRAAEP